MRLEPPIHNFRLYLLFHLLGLQLDVPDYTRLSRRGTVPLRQLEKMDEPGHLVIDSTGIKVFGESEWLETKTVQTQSLA